MKGVIVSISTLSLLLVGGYIGLQVTVNNEVDAIIYDMHSESDNTLAGTTGLSSYNPFTEQLHVPDIEFKFQNTAMGEGGLSIEDVYVHVSRGDLWDYYFSDNNTASVNIGESHVVMEGIAINFPSKFIASAFSGKGLPPFFDKTAIKGRLEAYTTLDEVNNTYLAKTTVSVNDLGSFSVDYAISAPKRVIDKFSEGVEINNDAALKKYSNDLKMIALKNMVISIQSEGIKDTLEYLQKNGQSTDLETESVSEWLANLESFALKTKMLPNNKVQKFFDVTNDAVNMDSDIVLEVSTSKSINAENIGALMMLSAARNGQDIWAVLQEEYGLDMDTKLSIQ